MAPRIRSMVTLSALPLLFTLVGASPTLATNPAILFGYVDGNIALASGLSFHNITGLPIPSGTWWVTATAQLDDTDYGFPDFGETTCRFGNGADLDQASWLLDGTPEARGLASMTLTTVHTSAAPWSANLDCITDQASVSIGHIRISAIKVFATGTDSPQVRSTFRASSVSIAGDNAYHAVRSLSIPPGRWWIVAKTSLLNDSTNDTNNPNCKVTLDADVDQTTQGLYYQPQQGTKGEVGLQLAHVFGTAGTASLKCKGTQDFVTDHVGLIAIKAGKLTRLAFGGPSTTNGNGTPTVMAGYKTGTTAIPSGATPTTFATLTLPAGNWLVSAKAVLQDGSDTEVTCRLELGGGNTDQSESRGAPAGGATGIYLQSARASSSAFNAKLRCSAMAAGTSLKQIRVTAISAGTLTISAMPV